MACHSTGLCIELGHSTGTSTHRRQPWRPEQRGLRHTEPPARRSRRAAPTWRGLRRAHRAHQEGRRSPHAHRAHQEGRCCRRISHETTWPARGRRTRPVRTPSAGPGASPWGGAVETLRARTGLQSHEQGASLAFVPHWPAVSRLLFSLASAGNFIRHWASAGFCPSPHWP